MRQVDREIAVRARVLRSDMTVAESQLWDKLKSRGLQGIKFRRQHAMGPYILDFYAPSHKLAVELDGMHHQDIDQKAYDNERTAYLESKGITVIRFTNRDISNMEEVLCAIAQSREDSHV